MMLVGDNANNLADKLMRHTFFFNNNRLHTLSDTPQSRPNPYLPPLTKDSPLLFDISTAAGAF